MKTLVVVQARTGSTRLPGKVLLPAAGAPVILRLLERVLAARPRFELVVATTVRPEDDALAERVHRFGVRVFRGHPRDLVDRHYRAALAARAEAVVKIPSDCPLVDPEAVDAVLGAFLAAAGRYDFVSNLHPPTWPDGNDVEVMTFAALERPSARPRGRTSASTRHPFCGTSPSASASATSSWRAAATSR